MTDEKAPEVLPLSGPIQRALDRRLDLSVPVPAEHAQLLSRLDQTRGQRGGHKFKIGQTVQFSPQGALATPGLYVVTVLPERDGEFEYSIYDEGEPYDCLAKESELR